MNNLTPETLDYAIAQLLKYFWVIIRGLTSIAGFLTLLIIDVVLGTIALPRMWPGMQDVKLMVFGIEVGNYGLAFIVSMAMSALQMAMWKKLLDNLEEGRPLIQGNADLARFIVAVIFSLVDSIIDGSVGFIATRTWDGPKGSEAWFMFGVFFILSAFGEPVADIIIDTYGGFKPSRLDNVTPQRRRNIYPSIPETPVEDRSVYQPINPSTGTISRTEAINAYNEVMREEQTDLNNPPAGWSVYPLRTRPGTYFIKSDDGDSIEWTQGEPLPW